MSDIDERVVEMSMDNKQFLDGVDSSLKAVTKLDNGMKFQNASSGFQMVTNAINKLDFSGMQSALDAIVDKFSFFGMMGVKALSMVEDKILSVARQGLQFANSMTFEQINSGWGKYNEKQKSVQTIMSATGKSVEEVNEALSDLNQFTDETSYSFGDMTSNIGKFTAVGVELKEAVSAMEGIASWAGMSGQNAQTASRAMYNLSQSMGLGYVNLMDWRSIENAGMGTKAFKEFAIAKAEAMGKINHGDVQVGNFSSTLADKWFDKDVLMATLTDYNSFFTQIQGVSKQTGLTITEIMGKLKKENGEYTAEAIAYAEKYGITLGTLGEQAFRASQEAKSLGDAIDATKDAISTSWMNSFEYIFGNKDEATATWTEFCEVLLDVFNASSEARNELLKLWHDAGGRTDLFAGIAASWDALTGYIDIFKKSLENVFPEVTADDLIAFTKGFKEFAESLAPSETTTARLGYLMKVLNEIILKSIDIFINIKDAIKGFVDGMLDGFDIVDAFFKAFGVGERFIKSLLTYINIITDGISEGLIRSLAGSGKILQDIFDTVWKAFNGMINAFSAGTKNIDFTKSFFKHMVDVGIDLGRVFKILLTLGKRLIETVLPVVTSLINNIFKTDIGGLPDILGGIHKWIEKLYTKIVLMDGWPDWLQSIVDLFKKLSDAVGKFFEKFKPIDTIINAFKSLWNGIKMVYGYIKGFIQDGLEKLKLSPEGSSFLDKLSNFGAILASGGIIILVKKLFEYFKAIKELRFMEGIKTFFNSVGSIFDKLKDAITAFQKDTPPDMLMKIAKSIALIAGSLFLLSLVKVDNLVAALAAFAATMQLMMRVMKKLGNTANPFSDTVNTLLKVSVAMAIVSASLALMATTKPERLLAAVAALAASLTMMLVFLKSLKGVRVSGSIKQLKHIAKAMLTLSIAFKIIGSMEWEQIGKALTAMGASLLIMMIIIHSLEGMKSTKNGTSAITKITFAMIPMAIALKILGSMGWEQIGKALTAMAGAMTIMVAAILIMSKLKGKNGGAGSILVMAMAMIPLAIALKILGSMDLDSIGRALFAVASVMTIFGVMVASMSGLKASMFAVSGALILFAVALLILTPALLAIGAIPMDMIIAAIINMGISIGAFAMASLLLAPVLPLMWSLATIMLMVGTAAILTGIGIATLAGALAGGSVAIVAAVAAILDIFIMFIPVVAVQLAIALKLFIQYLAGSVNELVAGLVTIILAICKGLMDIIPALIVLIGEGITLILVGLVDYIPAWADALADILEQLVVALGTLLGGVIKGIIDLCKMAYDAICDFFGIHSPSTVMADVGTFLIQGLINGIASMGGALWDGMVALGTGAFNAIKDGLGSLWDIGVNAVQGLIDGIGSMAAKIWDTAKSLGGSLLNGIKDFLGIHSPSVEMKKLGIFSVEGFVNGIDDNMNMVNSSAISMGSSFMNQLGDILSGDSVGYSPYVDFNNLQLADATMGNLFGQRSMELAVDVSRNRLQVENMRDIINETNAAIGDLKGAINDQKLEANVETPIYLDGREIARGTAKYTKKEIDNINRQNDRLGGRK